MSGPVLIRYRSNTHDGGGGVEGEVRVGSGGRTLDGKVLTDRQGTQHARRKRHEHFISKLRCLMLNQIESTRSIFFTAHTRSNYKTTAKNTRQRTENSRNSPVRQHAFLDPRKKSPSQPEPIHRDKAVYGFRAPSDDMTTQTNSRYNQLLSKKQTLGILALIAYVCMYICHTSLLLHEKRSMYQVVILRCSWHRSLMDWLNPFVCAQSLTTGNMFGKRIVSVVRK